MIEKKDLYRLPWSMNDNPIAWVEITDVCNIHCEGCYRQHMTGHKTLDQVKEEIIFFKKWRNPDNVSIAGGEPLVHPHILDIVSFIAENGIKPVILTNGLALKPDLVLDLKKVGLFGFIIHIDSHQNRPGWNGKTEGELNQLRQCYADMMAEAGGLKVIFNSTVYPSTFQQVPDVVRWAQANMDTVNGLVFITFRTASEEKSSAYDKTGSEIDLNRLSYTVPNFEEKFLMSPDIYRILKDTCPEYEPSGYLGGTVDHTSFKWLTGVVLGSGKTVYGSIGKKSMELAQAGNHLLKGTYMAYMADSSVGFKLFLPIVFDGTIRKAWQNRWKDVLRHPGRLFGKIYLQSIGIIQAPDLLPDGRADMCDSCPDMTVYDGKLVNSCRMDEYRLFGGMVSVVEKSKVPK